MDNEAEKYIQYGDDSSYLSEFFDAIERRDDLRSQITALKTKDEEVNNKIVSFENKICRYVQDGLSLANRWLKGIPSTLYALAKYDRSGIFLYFKDLTNQTENCLIHGMSTSLSGKKKIILYYGQGKTVVLPVEIIDIEGYNPRHLAERIAELCIKTVGELKENLGSVKFDKELK